MFSWLPCKSPDDEALLADRGAMASAPLDLLAELSRKQLSERDVRRVAAAVKKADHSPNLLAKLRLTPLRILLALQTTADLIVDELVVAGLRQGFVLTVSKTDFNQLADLAYGDYFDEPSQADIDYVLVGLDYRQLGFGHDIIGDADRAKVQLDSKLRFIRDIIGKVSAKTSAICIVQNLVPQPQWSIASIDRSIPGSADWFIEGFNREVSAVVGEAGHLQFDLAGLAAFVGLGDWHDRGMWYMAKVPFAQNFVPIYAHRLSTLIAAARGKSKKVLVLDLDNTLWGGVIGDDGVQGIVLGQGSAGGEAFLDIHRFALGLKARGVVLAVSSKNTDEIARNAFEQHPETLLKLTDFAMFSANWEDKASNISHIAKTLELGLDSFVFLDDNPVERELVRRTLPQVAVPEVGEDVAEYPSTLVAAGYFEALAFSAEDGRRAEMYRDNASRAALMESVGDLDSYLASLEMKMTITPFNETDRERTVQLINKSNQFNLTTRRYSAAEVIAAAADDTVYAITTRLADSFGDNGIIGVNVCHLVEDNWEFDTWLMSCRVLKRRVEEQILQHLIEEAARRGINRLKGVYKPNDRNALVAGHYAKLGFERDPGSPDDAQIWWLDVATYQVKKLPFALTTDA